MANQTPVRCHRCKSLTLVLPCTDETCHRCCCCSARAEGNLEGDKYLHKLFKNTYPEICDFCMKPICLYPDTRCLYFLHGCCRYCHPQSCFPKAPPPSDASFAAPLSAAAASDVLAFSSTLEVSPAAHAVLLLPATHTKVFNSCPHNCKLCVITSQFSGKCNMFCGNCKY